MNASFGRALLAALCLLLPTSVVADEMAFFIKNRLSLGMAVELHAQDRAFSWPGREEVYFLDVGERKSIPVKCTAGERICWAAWVAGDDRQSFGVGPDNDRICENCCVICVAKSTETIELTLE